MMKELLPQIVDLLVPVVMALLAWLSTAATKWINAKVQNEYVSGALSRLNDAVFTAVKATEQTVAAELREAAADGQITKEEAESIKSHAVDSVKAYLGNKGMGELKRVLDADSINKMIEDKIEAYLQDRKMDIAAMMIGDNGVPELDEDEEVETEVETEDGGE